MKLIYRSFGRWRVRRYSTFSALISAAWNRYRFERFVSDCEKAADFLLPE
jgi:hypothetical protein